MSIPVVCPACSARTKAASRFAGGMISCPKCDEPIPVPAPAPDEGAITERGRGRPGRKVLRDFDDESLPTPPDVSHRGIYVLIGGGIIALLALVLTTVVLVRLALQPKAAPAPVAQQQPQPTKIEPIVEKKHEEPAPVEPVYVDALKGPVRVGDFDVRVLRVRLDRIPLVPLLGAEQLSEQPALAIDVGISNLSPTKKLEYTGWSPAVGLAALENPGSALAVPATLKDDVGNSYRPMQFDPLVTIKDQKRRESIYPGGKLVDVLVFEVPVPKVSALLLELPLKALGANDSIRFRIPTDRINRSTIYSDK